MAPTNLIKVEGVLNLDVLFNIKDEEYGNVGHFANETMSRLKLAGNPRMWRGTELWDYYSFGGWTAEGEGRLVQNGPIVKGPHAYLFELGTVITAHKQAQETAYIIEEGTEIYLRGTTYTVHYPKRVGQQGKYPILIVKES